MDGPRISIQVTLELQDQVPEPLRKPFTYLYCACPSQSPVVRLRVHPRCQHAARRGGSLHRAKLEEKYNGAAAHPEKRCPASGAPFCPCPTVRLDTDWQAGVTAERYLCDSYGRSNMRMVGFGFPPTEACTIPMISPTP